MIINWWPISWFVYKWYHFSCQRTNININVMTSSFDRYPYAGLQNQAECWCGNQYGTVAETDGSPCLVCRGEYDSLCGRSYKNSVYRTEAARLEQGRTVCTTGQPFERHLLKFTTDFQVWTIQNSNLFWQLDFLWSILAEVSFKGCPINLCVLLGTRFFSGLSKLSAGKNDFVT